jgi:hypothetical protein
MQVASKDQAIMSKSDETPANATATIKKAVGNANAAFLLWRIVYWCTRKKGGVMYEGRVWSYRSQKQWIEQEVGLCERTGKRAWARLVEGDFIMTEMRLGGPLGNRRTIMHVALSDKTYALLEAAGVPNLTMPLMKAELAIMNYAGTAKKAAWDDKIKADIAAMKAAGEWDTGD